MKINWIVFIISLIFTTTVNAGWDNIDRNARFLGKAEGWYLKKLNNMDTLLTTDDFENSDTEEDIKFYSHLSIKDAYSNLLYKVYSAKKRAPLFKKIKKYAGQEILVAIKNDILEVDKAKWDLEATRQDKLETKAEVHASNTIKKITKKFNDQKRLVKKKAGNKNKGV